MNLPPFLLPEPDLSTPASPDSDTETIAHPSTHIDLLTGCFSLLEFSRALSHNFNNHDHAPLSFVAIEVHRLNEINNRRGRAFGDQLLRWLCLATKSLIAPHIYRISGDEFIAVIIGETHQEHARKAQAFLDLMNQQAQQLDLPLPLVYITVFHLPAGATCHPAYIWKALNDNHLLPPAKRTSFRTVTIDDQTMRNDLVQVLIGMTQRLTDLAYMIEHASRLAYTDPISGAPNTLASHYTLELSLVEARRTTAPLSLILLDGDDLKKYNSINFLEGDHAIRHLYTWLTRGLRPGDFIGRWRMGDEFLVILTHTDLQTAIPVAERLRLLVEQTSLHTAYPMTISLGIATFPDHGQTASALLASAERSLKRAKLAGKNRLFWPDDTP